MNANSLGRLLAVACFFAGCTTIFSQKKETVNDSTSVLSEVVIHGFLSEYRISQVPASVSVLTAAQLKLHPNNSLVGGMNTLSGVRMEERTPGSYRLSLRGSALRSPFGIRNVKLYLGEIPLTDASGNTYLNALDVSGLHNIEVMKGPNGSLFGANSGGVVLLDVMQDERIENVAALRFEGGSYGLFRQNAKVSHSIGNHKLEIYQAYQNYDGYREHSSMQRNYFQLSDKYTYHKMNSLKFFGFYSKLKYQTPGGLTLEQFHKNPRSARPATAFSPGAIEQQIGIRSDIFLGGIVNEIQLSNSLRNKTAFFGTAVDFENPFITNFEKRKETTYGARSYFEYSNAGGSDFKWNAVAGAEWQRTDSDINNYDNLGGSVGDPQVFDELSTTQHFIFARCAAVFGRLHIEAGASLNNYGYKFRNVYPFNEQDRATRNFAPEFMPRLAASYKMSKQLNWRFTISRGYSTPTIAEVRSTDNVVNTGLQSETGWNFETGFRLFDAGNRFRIDASLFYYRLDNAIVNQRLSDDTDFFVNAGGTGQWGLEVELNTALLEKRATGFIREIRLSQTATVNRFRFRDYQVNGNDYSGNDLTGTPAYVLVTGLHVLFPKRFYFYLQGNFTGRLPLNDGNTAYASAYQLLQAKAEWNFALYKANAGIAAGIDNILNQNYSLGNDLNAFGNRFYNPAPGRNVYLGFSIRL